jgi:hypothetical protein
LTVIKNLIVSSSIYNGMDPLKLKFNLECYCLNHNTGNVMYVMMADVQNVLPDKLPSCLSRKGIACSNRIHTHYKLNL